MARGYRRVTIGGCGAGAAEVWSAVLGPELPDQPRSVGVVRQVFDRSAYLEFDAAALGEITVLGPPLVLLAGEGFDGPLATRLTSDHPGGFRPDGLAVGDDCRLRAGAGSAEHPRAVLAIGEPFEIAIDPAVVEAGLAAGPQGASPNPRWDSALLRERAGRAVDLLRESDHKDGLEWFDDVAAIADGRPPTGERAALVNWWVSYLAGDDREPAPPLDILGRGPGATPSGDDVLSGLLLGLERLTTGRQRERVRGAGERIVEAAADRTTTVSAALLAQAVQGRALVPVDAAIGYLLDQDSPRGADESCVLAAADVGHTSGVDLLVGVLLVSLGIAPRLIPDTELG